MLHLLFRNIVRTRSKIVVRRISPYIKNSTKIIDIGSGTGDIAYLLQQQGMNVTPVDVGDFHGPRLMKTTLYDGKTLPSPNHSFDTALLLMVLHHTSNPEIVFAEASRVAKKVVVIETSYTNVFNKVLTVISDAMGNLRTEVFWKSYKTDGEWRIFFKKYGFTMVDSRTFNDRHLGIIPFLHILYFLKRK